MHTSTTIAIAATAIAALLTACGSTQEATDPTRGQGADPRQTLTYVGDPWEKRSRDQFWETSHIHDSWNRCHLAETVPTRLQRGTDCFPTLRSPTARSAATAGGIWSASTSRPASASPRPGGVVSGSGKGGAEILRDHPSETVRGRAPGP